VIRSLILVGRGRSRGPAPTPAAPLLAGAALLLLAVPAWAGGTAAFRVSSFADLNKGEPLGTFISSKGEVTAGRDSKRLKSPQASMVWSSVRDGATVYFGTGDEASLWAVKDEQVRKVADLDGVLVTALVRGPNGKLLAAVMPKARIVEVDPASGKWRELGRLPSKHVWALIHDAKARTIYAAGGSPGTLYTLPEAGGKPAVYYESGESHLLSLTRDRGGALLAGSSDSAILFRITGKTKGMALHDFDATELRDVAVAADGTLWVAVNKFERRTSGLPRFDRSEDGEEGTAFKAGASDKAAKKPKPKVRPQELRPGARSGKGALFAIDPNGRVDEVLSLDTGYFTRLEIDDKGVVWAADGAKGKVYLANPDRTVVTAFDFPERQVLALAISGGTPYLGTGDAGAIYKVSAGRGAKPVYESHVFDGKFSSRWGNLQLQASEGIRLESRSGNTAKANKTWSGWTAAKMFSKTVGRVLSAPARYLQLRFTWQGGKDGVLRSFTAYYQPQNQRARVTDVTVGGAGSDEKKDKEKRSAKMKIKWKTENPDGDALVYRVYYREELGVTWRLTSGHDPLEKAEYDWDTEPVPDGYYRIKVVASDEKDNPEDTTLTDWELSERVLVDNRKPEVVGLTVRRPWVSGMAKDSYSTIKRVEYSIDGGTWHMVGALDGIFDSPAEAFRVKIPDNLGPGAHVIAVRALDEADNMGVAQARFVR
jgi:hypothetical protein